ncbi:hypothetical protein [Moorena sp. SIO4A5]|uniref:hypothetical protein n=1 Tax=Moorena sp. SIO4A5 TaxID=2607838 RepID=UPI0013CD0558|nr:hypothetical protein [Moorena sp. SIO4A5]NEO21452.1 hypothetical protein [Moorena sp. SIO4A5]
MPVTIRRTFLILATEKIRGSPSLTHPTHSRFPTPDSLFPIPYSLFPIPLYPTAIDIIRTQNNDIHVGS